MTKEQILTIVAARQSRRKYHLVFNAQYLPYKKNLPRNRGDSHNRTEKCNRDRLAFHPRNWPCSFFVVF